MADLGSQKRHRRINLTDPEARLMKGRQGIVAGYNAQAMVSPMETDEGATSMLVTAVDVVDQANDNALLVPMMEQAEETTGTKSQMTLADAGYFAANHLAECDRRGQKVVVSSVPGYRESTESWSEVLRDMKRRGLECPRLVIGDGHLGIWGALRNVYPQAAEQRCWNHKMMNVLDKLPKRQQGEAKLMLRAIPYAETRADAERLRTAFSKWCRDRS